ncbi:hypothetical protein GM3708_778 [Geminocystis sp. NIES-3708]|nr:hypothetical protein GM3708_778 [Geminocystis sp. NIES-3708]
MELAKKRLKLKLFWSKDMLNNNQKKIAICIKNDDYLASLEIRKIYQVLPDEKAQQLNMLRIIDESEEDYLYPASYFVVLELPEVAQKLFAEVS